jgi:DNA-binding NarL/FixJ family response regulator
MALRVLISKGPPDVLGPIPALLQAAGLSVVGQASNGEDAVRLTEVLELDVVILDDSLLRGCGVEAARAIRRTRPHLPIILLTGTPTCCHIASAFGAGVRGYVLKVDAGDDLIRAIYDVTRGVTFVSPGASRELCEAYLTLRPRQP